MIITVPSWTLNPAFQLPGSSGTIRLYYTASFNSGGVSVQGSPVRSKHFFDEMTWIAVAGVMTVATFANLISTTNSREAPAAEVIGEIYVGDSYIGRAFAWRVPDSLGATVTKEALDIYNTPYPPRPPRPGFLDEDQINNLIATALGSRSFAAVGVAGIIETTVDPVNPSRPKAVEDADPRVNASYNIKKYGAPGNGASELSSSAWRALYGIPVSLAGAYLGGNAFGTLTFVDGTDTKDFVALAYAVWLAGENRGSYIPGTGNTLIKSIAVDIPPGTYNLNRVVGLYSSHYLRGTNAVLVRSGAGAIFDVKDPVKTVITGLQFQGGTNAILVAESNLDATELDVTNCLFQGQTDYPVKGGSTAVGMPKTLRVRDNKFLNTAGGVMNTGNQAIIEGNWFEFFTTNPLLYNDGGQAVFRNNRITNGAAPPDWLVVNKGHLDCDWNQQGSEGSPKGFVQIASGATYTSLKENVVHSGAANYNVQIDTYPLNVFIEGNWFQNNNGFIVNDNYVGLVPAAGLETAIATSNNTFTNNQQGNSGTPALPFIAFKNGGLYFTIDGAAVGRGAWTREIPVVKPDTDFANLFGDNSEAISGNWTASGVSFVNNTVTAPDGSTTGSNIIGNAFGTLDSAGITTASLGGTGYYTLSLYVRNYAAANIVSIFNSTDSTIVVARPLSVSTEWVRLAISFHAVTGKTYKLRFNLVTGGGLHAWGYQINPGYHAAPYLYRNTNAKASLFPFAGPERPIYYVSAMPTNGDWKAGVLALLTTPVEAGAAASKYVIIGWVRITTGSGNVLNTDWLEMRTLTGN